MKVLFVCDCAVNRSPTFMRWFKENKQNMKWKGDNGPDNEYRCGGLYWGYPDRCDKESLKWADKVYVMTLLQHKFINEKYPEYIHKVSVIGIEDIYEPDQEELIELIEYFAKEMI